jgi:hypothetical protein
VLEVPGHGTLIAKLRRQLMPWAAGAQTEDETIQHRARVDTAMPLKLGGGALAAERLNGRPYVVRYFPDRKRSGSRIEYSLSTNVYVV